MPQTDQMQQRPHKHQRVEAWLARNPRVHMHFTPTYASWLNLV
jgi:putative transposase